jgi:hypothetical protein
MRANFTMSQKTRTKQLFDSDSIYNRAVHKLQNNLPLSHKESKMIDKVDARLRHPRKNGRWRPNTESEQTMTTFILVNKKGETIKVAARSIISAFRLANEQNFEVADWEVEEGEEFTTDIETGRLAR